MRGNIAIYALLMSASFLLYGCAGNGSSAGNDEPAPPSTTANELLKAIEGDLAGLKKYAIDNGMRLDKIELTISGSMTDAGSAGIKILIFKVGSSRAEEATAQYTILLDDLPRTESTGLEDSAEEFAEALKGFIDSRPSILDYDMQSLVGTLKFILKVKGSGSMSSEFDVVPLSVDLGREVSASYVHSLKLTFTKL